MAQLKRVMISSTARDLPEHRDKVMHACMRLGMFYPEMMENLTATDANALQVSLKMVDAADIYIGVFAFDMAMSRMASLSRSRKRNMTARSTVTLRV